MSLINKMLGDLEKRDAFLNENQDMVLDGLYSAYDLESGSKSNRYIRLIVSISIVVLLVVSIISYDYIKVQGISVMAHYNSLISNIKSGIEQKDENEVIPPIYEDAKDEIQKKNNIGLSSNLDLNVDLKDENEVVPIISEEFKSKIQKRNHFLKLDHDLFLQELIQSEISVTETLNRIEDIHFETDSNGISLVMRMPDDIDYLVYGLTNPNRTIVKLIMLN